MRHYKYGEEINTKMVYSEQVLFCVNFLRERGILAKQYSDICKALKGKKPAEYKLVPVNESFFCKLAENLRDLWPPGDKEVLLDGKIQRYPWRDSVDNLAKRLEVLWTNRFKGKDFTMEQCLTAARQYLNDFQNSVKYMQLLKYFILKQGNFKDPGSGKTHYTYESKFADILESNENLTSWENAFDEVRTTPLDEGDLI